MVDFPVQGQETTDYAAFGRAVGEVETDALCYVGVGVFAHRGVTLLKPTMGRPADPGENHDPATISIAQGA